MGEKLHATIGEILDAKRRSPPPSRADPLVTVKRVIRTRLLYGGSPVVLVLLPETYDECFDLYTEASEALGPASVNPNFVEGDLWIRVTVDDPLGAQAASEFVDESAWPGCRWELRRREEVMFSSQL